MRMQVIIDCSPMRIPSDSPMFSCLQRSFPLSNNDTKQFEISLYCSHLRKPGCSLVFEPDQSFRLRFQLSTR